MADRMVRVGNADFRIRAIVLFTRELERDNARDVRLESQNLKVEHKLNVVGEFRGNAYRPFRIGLLGIGRRMLGPLDLTLYFTNTVEILFHTPAVGNADALLESRDVHAERVEQASTIAQPFTPRGRIAALTEQALEDDPR